MNLPNKITLSRIFLTIIILIFLLFPFDAVGISLPNLYINETLVVDIKYMIVGLLFIIAIITDTIDGNLARKYKMETVVGAVMDDIADKVLIDSILIELSTCGFISSIIPLIIINTDIINYSLKVGCSSQENKYNNSIKKMRNFFMYFGIMLTLFYNLPFELINLRIADSLLVISSILSIVMTLQNIEISKKFLKMQ